MTVTRRQWAEMKASMTNALKLMAGNESLIRGRWADWEPGPQAQQFDPDRTTAPNRVVEINGTREVIPNISDPTGETATRPAERGVVDIDRVVTRFTAAARELEQALADATRSEDPSKFEREKTNAANQVDHAAGICEACGRDLTGRAKKVTKMHDGRRLCIGRCYERAIRDNRRGITTDASVTSYRALMASSGHWSTPDDAA